MKTTTEQAVSHTPGPWHYQEGNTYFEKMGRMMTADLILANPYQADEKWLAAVWQDHVGVDEQEANAALIAAAPDLLEACRTILAAADLEVNTFGDDAHQLAKFIVYRTGALQAISKALPNSGQSGTGKGGE